MCDKVLEGRHFKYTSATGRQEQGEVGYPSANCTTRGVIYLIQTNLHYIQYVGLTEKSLMEAFEVYRSKINNREKNGVPPGLYNFFFDRPEDMKVKVSPSTSILGEVRNVAI